MTKKLTLSIQSVVLGICRLDPSTPIPAWALNNEFFSITKTGEELSVVCPEQIIPSGIKSEKGWRAIKIEGPINFTATGILSSLLQPLADKGISIFTVSTFDTDYVLVKKENLENAISILKRNNQINF